MGIPLRTAEDHASIKAHAAKLSVELAGLPRHIALAAVAETLGWLISQVGPKPGAVAASEVANEATRHADERRRLGGSHDAP